MTRFLSAAAVVLVATFLTGCKSEAESAMSDMVDKQKEVVKVLQGVKDKDSAAAAKPKLDKLKKEIDEVASRLSKAKTDADEEKKIREKYQPQFEQAMKDMVSEMVRIAQIPGAGEQLGGTMGSPFGGGFGGPMGGRMDK